jgi:hypothetical protein
MISAKGLIVPLFKNTLVFSVTYENNEMYSMSSEVWLMYDIVRRALHVASEMIPKHPVSSANNIALTMLQNYEYIPALGSAVPSISHLPYTLYLLFSFCLNLLPSNYYLSSPCAHCSFICYYEEL